jgi:hypothetical protein
MLFNERGFGILIAFVIPGWVVLLGCGLHSPMVAAWLSGAGQNQPAVGEFLYSLLAAVTLGMLTSTVRWLVVDQVLKRLLPRGVGQPDFRGLRNLNAELQTLIEGHYRYYQFHANLLVASTAAAALRWLAFDFRVHELVGALCLWAVLGLGAKNTFYLYHKRVGQLLSTEPTVWSLILPGTK